jgi:DNA-binding IclR family transcriptional regulator
MNIHNRNESTNSVRAVERACEVLYYIAEHPGKGLTEIAASLSLPKATVFRILRTLKSYALVDQDQVTDLYSIGKGFFRLGSAALTQMDLVKISMPYMQDIVAKVGANATLNILQNKYRVVVSRVEGEERFRLYHYLPIGTPVPLYVGAGGKVILASLSDSQIDEIIREQIEESENSFNIDIAKLRAEIAQIRKDGYAITLDEMGLGARSIAEPLISPTHNIIASINISFPIGNASEEKSHEVIRLLQKAISEIHYYLYR